jgi:NADH:ubiquinone oxidoreductase subunit 2 (subunit N)
VRATSYRFESDQRYKNNNLLNITSILPDVTFLLLIAFISIYKFLGFNKSRFYIASFSVGLVTASILLVQQFYFNPHFSFYYNIAVDGYSITFKLFTLVLTAFIYFFTDEFKDNELYRAILTYLTLLFSVFISISSNNILLTFFSFEIISLTIQFTLYSQDPGNAKRFYRSWIISSALMLFGISLFYGLFGSLNYNNVSLYLSVYPVNKLTLSISILMIFCGFAFKLFIFPLHAVITGIFEKAATGKSAIFFLTSVIAGSGALNRFIFVAFNDPVTFNSKDIQHLLSPVFDWGLLLMIIFCITVLSSSFMLFLQKDLLKINIYIFLANIPIFLSGFSIISYSHLTVNTMLLLQAIIPFSGIILLVKYLENYLSVKYINDLKGIHRSSPVIILLLLFFWLSLAGFPLTFGFTSRLYLFSAVSGRFLFLIISVTTLSSLIIYYKLFLIMRITFISEQSKERIKLDYKIALITGILAVFLLLFGLYSAPLINLLNIISNIVYI